MRLARSGMVLAIAACLASHSATALGTDEPASTHGTAVVRPAADSDGDGYTTTDCAPTDPKIHPGAVDLPDARYVDRDCDGYDGTLAKAILVRSTGTDSATCGSKAAPCRTIAHGLANAAARKKRDVWVAGGSYAGTVVLRSGIHLFGGFGQNWQRRPSKATGSRVTTLTGQAAFNLGSAAEPVTVHATGLTRPTRLAFLTLKGRRATGTLPDGTGRNSYVIVVRATAAGKLSIHDITIVAGNGAAGSDGAAGADAAALSATEAMKGADGGDGVEEVRFCDETARGLGGVAGTNAAAGGTAAGGKGGSGGTMDTDCDVFGPDYDARPGSAGANAATSSAAGGRGSAGGTGSDACGPVQAGQSGIVANGAGGAAPSASGRLASGLWRPAKGTAGAAGADGGGGGGGGGAGGCDQGTDSFGAGGGGGGAGGLAGKGGGPGAGGGGSFGIHLVDASPTISRVVITRGRGGDGGDGGRGGQGQEGGEGGDSGAHPGGAAAGSGGHGGHGGHGGGGAGGAGGIAVGVFSAGASSPTMKAVTISGGTGGAGGAAGVSAPNATTIDDGNDGAAGPEGILATTLSCPGAGAC